jgi:hypothetical protein
LCNISIDENRLDDKNKEIGKIARNRSYPELFVAVPVTGIEIYK